MCCTMSMIHKTNLLIAISLIIILSTNALANCPPGCQCDDNLLVVQCGEGQLDVLPIALNPSIQRLVIKRNKIKTIDSSIQFYAELAFLDLSANHLMTIPQRTFAYQKKLHELHLNDNKIGQLSNRTFLGLGMLNVLNLRGNLISELHAGVFAAMTRLEELNLGENRIGLIDPRAFESLTQLRILYLDDNALTTVPDANILQTMPRLAELMLGGNALETLPAQAFANAGAGLTRLDLRGANLRNIAAEAFQKLGSSLRVLDLSGNRLTKIPTVALSVLQRLEQLTLGENDFESIPEGAFMGLKQLQQLDISGALRLKRVMHEAFSFNTNLQYLQLSSNKMLTEVQEGALSGLPHLRHVILKANALSTLAEGMFPWRDLITLDISENPWVCDCRIMWLRNLRLLRNASSASDSEEILCAFPERLRGEALRNLNPQLMDCLHGGEARRQALVGALLVGAAATITALALVIYRCRRKLREFLTQGGSFGGRSKEREYQKTFCDEDYMTRHHMPVLPNHTASGLMQHYAQHNPHYLPHQVACNMYTPPHQPYSMCNLENSAGYNNKNCHMNSLDSVKHIKNCATACLDDSASFMMLMKGNTHTGTAAKPLYQKQPAPQAQQQQQQQQQQLAQPQYHMGGKLNHYTKSASVSSSNESSYSYVDVPLVHALTDHAPHFKQQQQQPQQQQQTAQQLQEYCSAALTADAEDPNYIYSNAHYSLPLERCGSVASTRANATKAIAAPSPIPPALPLRNGARRSFNLNYNNNNNKNTNNNNNSQNNSSSTLHLNTSSNNNNVSSSSSILRNYH